MAQSLCSEMQSLLCKKAPYFRPLVLPKGYGGLRDFTSGLKDKETKEQLDYITEQRKERTLICSTSDCGSLNDSLSFTFCVSWRIDYHTKHLIMGQGLFLCSTCLRLYKLEEFLSTVPTMKTVSDLVTHFKLVNRVRLETEQESIIYFHECFGLSYSLKVLASSIPSLLVVDSKGRLVSNLSASELEMELFPSKLGLVLSKPQKCTDSNENKTDPSPIPALIAKESEQSENKKRRRSRSTPRKHKTKEG
eukprot:TRINITY_DN30850_c0_g1_i1.p1 TRINITY_DN30850_c0_g1~~TRINITY_DN30850_c0_g1_i1.p1  ORF type:complete len:273 (-),score=51.33 TRINITY_DN30850_c0_g1_i1:73-819(-)